VQKREATISHFCGRNRLNRRRKFLPMRGFRHQERESGEAANLRACRCSDLDWRPRAAWSNVDVTLLRAGAGLEASGAPFQAGSVNYSSKARNAGCWLPEFFDLALTANVEVCAGCPYTSAFTRWAQRASELLQLVLILLCGDCAVVPWRWLFGGCGSPHRYPSWQVP